MKFPLLILVAAIALQLGAPPTSQAQTTAPAAAYTGPRYPGGPDSLRALVYRSTRTTTPAPAGRMLVQFELQSDGKAYNLTMVRPPDPINPELVKATAAALDYLEAHMLPWLLGSTRLAEAVGKPPKISLVMDFATPPAAWAYNYGDQQPVFAAALEVMRTRFSKMQQQPEDSVQQSLFASSSRTLISYIQLQVKYPPNALRYQQQGQVYIYFEVAESGAIENPQVVGTAGKYLDDETLKIVRKLPAANVAAQLRGQPVRVYYALPITFKIM
ncbi:energy transducer TonB [Hymenobacter sp. IS2118]|uniref:energy transducer TonB n=1 Tax=Hymenobacter sp. IS2118 TaxID=1505605 RepID=UPI00054E8999|nr:energy transducer TonB [Hymenobacter sp. IS2118]